LIHRTRLAALLICILASLGTAQALPKRVYIAPDDHTDYFWTAGESTYRQVFLDTLDYYLNQADATAADPPDYQARWNCDGSLWMWTYEKNRTAAQFGRLIDRIRDGHITVPLNPLVVLHGAAPAEAILRGMYYPGSIERRFGLSFPLAISMENQTQPLGLSSLWAGSGARYSWKGICGCDSPVGDAWDRDHDLYWSTGLDGQRVLMKWNSQLMQSGKAMGGYAEAFDTPGVVDYVTDSAPFNGFLNRYPYDVIGCFGKGWDNLMTTTTEFPQVALARSRPDRRVIVSNQVDYFQDFEATYPPETIPSMTASFGNDWEADVASLPEVSARIKRSTEKLRAAEAMASVVTLQNPCLLTGRETARDQAFLDLGLYYEHDFGMGGRSGSIVDERIAWQKRLATEIETYVDALHADSAAALGTLIAGGGAATRFFVFNPLGWARSDAVDLPYVPVGPIHVVDVATGGEIPSQTMTSGGATSVRVLVRDVPAVGYKVVEVLPGAGAGALPGAPPTAAVDTVENSLYRVTLSPRGAITGWIDKAHGSRQLVRDVLGRAMNDLGPGSGQVQVESVGPVSATLVATATGPYLHTTRVTLYRDLERVDIRNDINQGLPQQRIEWGFGHALDGAVVHHEEVGAVLRVGTTDADGNYSPRSARYDTLTLNHFADVGDSAYGFTLSNADAYFMRVGDSTAGTLDTTTTRLNVMALYEHGLPNQGGDTHFMFRFGLRARDAWDPAGALRFALEHQNPLVAGPVTGSGPFPDSSYSLVTVTDPAALLWTLKPAEEGVTRGLVARLWNVSAAAVTPDVAFSAGAADAALALSHIETAEGPAPVAGDGSIAVGLAPWQMRTVLARLTVTSPVASPVLQMLKPTGSSVIMRWGPTGQTCYTTVKSASPDMSAAQRIFEGLGTLASDNAPIPVGSVTYYSVE